MRSISSSTLHIVRIARLSTEVNTMSGSRPAFLISAPADFASMRPRSDRSTSCQPVKRFSTFQTLWPCRTRINFPGVDLPACALSVGERNLSRRYSSCAPGAAMRVEAALAAAPALAVRLGQHREIRRQCGARCRADGAGARRCRRTAASGAARRRFRAARTSSLSSGPQPSIASLKPFTRTRSSRQKPWLQPLTAMTPLASRRGPRSSARRA